MTQDIAFFAANKLQVRQICAKYESTGVKAKKRTVSQAFGGEDVAASQRREEREIANTSANLVKAYALATIAYTMAAPTVSARCYFCARSQLIRRSSPIWPRMSFGSRRPLVE